MLSTKGRSVVSAPIRTRASLEQIAAMVKYAAQPALRREGLLRFLVASICTLARPNAIFDMNVAKERFQYDEKDGFFNLNPLGRQQTKKYRPTVPILPGLKNLLETANDEGWVVHYYGRRVQDVRSSWRQMIKDLGYEGGREWGAYVMRRSMSQLLRESGAQPWDVQGLMGHRMAGTTETYTAASLFPSAMTKLEIIIAEIESKSGVSLASIHRHEV